MAKANDGQAVTDLLSRLYGPSAGTRDFDVGCNMDLGLAPEFLKIQLRIQRPSLDMGKPSMASLRQELPCPRSRQRHRASIPPDVKFVPPSYSTEWPARCTYPTGAILLAI